MSAVAPDRRRDPRYEYKRDWWRARRAYLAVLRAQANPEPERAEEELGLPDDPLAEARAAMAPWREWSRLASGPLHRDQP